MLLSGLVQKRFSFLGKEGTPTLSAASPWLKQLLRLRRSPFAQLKRNNRANLPNLCLQTSFLPKFPDNYSEKRSR
jgi:hypothetical protein